MSAEARIFLRIYSAHARRHAHPQRRMAAIESRTSAVAAAAHRLWQLHETLAANASPGAAAGGTAAGGTDDSAPAPAPPPAFGHSIAFGLHSYGRWSHSESTQYIL
jgi:hypothetical protein